MRNVTSIVGGLHQYRVQLVALEFTMQSPSIPNSGSFIRPTAQNLSYGVSFLQALSTKYVEQLHGVATQEKVILGSSNGSIEVEGPHLDKIRTKLARLDRLRDVSLDGEKVARADPGDTIRRTCSST